MARLQPLLVLSLVAAVAACTARVNPTPAPAPTPAPDPAAVAVRDSLPTYDEITRQTVEVFGDSVVPEALLADAGELEEAEEISWDIDVRSYETHARVEHYVGIFSGDAAVRIGERLSRGTAYEAMIRSKLRAAGLPEDIYYLALIESGYDPHARSRAMAIGMWQFMTTTARGVGMRVDWWVDERRDPFRSTDAAITFLRSLQRQFGGSLYLAAAAYNGGPGRISRGLTRFAEDLEGTTGDDLAFALSDRNYLPSETRNYVPQLIAAALVGKEPARYGIEVLALPPVEYDSVRVGETTPLAAVARASGSTLAEITELNPHILRGVTPPRQSFWVRVPRGRTEGFDEALSALDAKELVAFTRLSTRRGDTFATVAREQGMTVEQLGWYNQRDRNTRGALPPGTTILVPTRDVLSAARSIPDPSLERYSSSARTHTVRSGETLSHISRRYQVPVAQLMRMNNMRSTVIRPGQRIIVSR